MNNHQTSNYCQQRKRNVITYTQKEKHILIPKELIALTHPCRNWMAIPVVNYNDLIEKA